MTVYLLWLLSVILWNFGFPEAEPVYDVIAAVILGLCSSKLKNIINTSIRLNLTISVNNSNIIKIDQFEETLSNIELINNFNIFKFDNKRNIYKIVFNGTRDQFLDAMKDFNYFFEIKNKIWVLK